MGTHSPAGMAYDVIVVTVMMIACRAPLHAQQKHSHAHEMRGVVVDSSSHEPVAGATVSLASKEGKVVSRKLTGADGRFAFTLRRSGAYAMRVDALGYAPYTTHLLVADTSEQVSTTVDLEPEPVLLKGLNVTATAIHQNLQRVGFYRREKIGFGDFLTLKKIRERNPGRLTDLFHGLSGVHVVCPPSDPSSCDVRMPGAGTQLISAAGRYCYPSVAIDGIVVRHGGENERAPWSTLVNVNDIVAVEVYPTSAGAPPWVGGNESPCGAILIWTTGQ